METRPQQQPVETQRQQVDRRQQPAEPRHRRQEVDGGRRRRSEPEYVDEQVMSIELDDDDEGPARQTSRPSTTQHVIDPSPASPPVPAAAAAAVTHQDPAVPCTVSGGVTSIRVRDVGRRQQLPVDSASSPYFCSRVSVGGSTVGRQTVVNNQPSVTRVTTLSRGSAPRRPDLHQQTA